MRINPDNKKYVIAEGLTGRIQKNQSGVYPCTSVEF